MAVLALEHADGSASTVALGGGLGHQFYAGWPDFDERERQVK